MPQGYFRIGPVVDGRAPIVAVQWGPAAAQDIADWPSSEKAPLDDFAVAASPSLYEVPVVDGVIGEPVLAPPPPPLAPHERPLTRPQWTWALDRYDLFAPLNAAIDAIPDSGRRAAIRQALVRETYHYADVLALIADNQDVLPAGIADLTEADIQVMWAATLSAVPS